MCDAPGGYTVRSLVAWTLASTLISGSERTVVVMRRRRRHVNGRIVGDPCSTATSLSPGSRWIIGGHVHRERRKGGARLRRPFAHATSGR